MIGNKKKSVAIVGHGYVGKAMYKFFENHYDMVIYDPGIPDPAKIGIKTGTKADVSSCDLAVICVPTPTGADGSCDISIVEDSIKWVATPLILLKSTVEVGTTERLRNETGKRIVFSPEYCGESAYWSPYAFHTDVKETPWFTFGGDPKDTEEMVYYFMKVVGPTKIYHQTDATTAELAKYVENTFYAMKVVFCYEIAEICKRIGVDYNKMREAWLLDPRLNRMHTAVFSENVKPVSGKCVLPKARVNIRGRADVSNESIVLPPFDAGDGIDIESFYQIFLKHSHWLFEIESANSDLSCLEGKKIADVTKRYVEENLFVFETDTGEFVCTAEHLMPVERDGKILIIPARDVKETDLFFCKEMESTLQEKVNDNRVFTN